MLKSYDSELFRQTEPMEKTMEKTLVKSRTRKKSKRFNPNREYLDEAVKEYFEEGGKITRIVDISEEYENIIGHLEVNSPLVDDFLLRG